MKRPWFLILGALLAGGCRSPSTTYDPFLGRSTVPPPATGAAAPGAPYYAPPVVAVPSYPVGATPPIVAQPQSLAPAGVMPPLSAPPGTLPPATPGLQPQQIQPPPGGFSSSQNLPVLSPDPRLTAPAIGAPGTYAGATTIPPTPDLTTMAGPPNAFAGAGRSAPGSMRSLIDPAVAPASYIAPVPTASPSTVNKPISTSPIRILNLGAGDGATALPNIAVDDRGTNIAESSRAGATYSYDPAYRQLQGKLEFSQNQNRWKLRYIPADGQTDDFGGSVVFSDSPVLANYQAGDFVSVQGAIVQKSDTRGFAPLFQLARIQRQ